LGSAFEIPWRIEKDLFVTLAADYTKKPHFTQQKLREAAQFPSINRYR
jgi:hypothetical protein